MPFDRRRPRLGYLLAAVAALMFAVNGSIAKFLLDDGVSAVHLSQLRATLSFALLAGVLVLVDRSRLRIARADVARMAWLGIAGLALVQLTYFLAIERLPISVALVIQFTGPLLVLLWLRAAHGRRLKPSLYGAVALSLVGSALVVEVYDAGALDGLGVAFAVAAAVTFALYLVGFERAGHRYDAFTTLTWGLGFATLFCRRRASASSPRSSRCWRRRSRGRSTARRWRRSRSRAACWWSSPSHECRRTRRRRRSKPCR